MEEINGEKWYSSAEVAEMFGLNKVYLSHVWIRAGKFPNAFKDMSKGQKGHWRIPESDIRHCAENLPVKKPRTRRPKRSERSDAYFRRHRDNRS